MKNKRLRACPDCEIYIPLKKEKRDGKSYMVCPKCRFESEFKERNRPYKYLKPGEDF